ncbi:MAG: histidine phosphatase family protein [Tepidiformaceae bacterium]
MTIYLVRHGETGHNRDGLGLGRADVELTDLGMAQARAVADRLASAPVSRVLASPLTRAFDGAQAIAKRHGLEPEISAALTELDAGETEGFPFAEIRERFPEFLKTWAAESGWEATMPGGESIRDVADRLEPLAAELLDGGDQEIVVVSHNFTLRVLACHLLGISPARFRTFEIGLASITALVVRGGRCHVRSVNDRCHLAHLNLA